MKRSNELILVVTVLLFVLAGCGNTNFNNGTEVESVDNNLTIDVENSEEITSEENIQDEASDETSENMEEETVKEEETLMYNGDLSLTSDNFCEVIKKLVSIKDSDDLALLEDIPLTEELFNRYVEDFPYIENIEDYSAINVEFWSYNDDGTIICVIDLCQYSNPGGNPILNTADEAYAIMIELEDDKMSNISMTKVK